MDRHDVVNAPNGCATKCCVKSLLQSAIGAATWGCSVDLWQQHHSITCRKMQPVALLMNQSKAYKTCIACKQEEQQARPYSDYKAKGGEVASLCRIMTSQTAD